MTLTCSQMDVLISFYIDGELSSALKAKVEEHIKNCPSCKAKYDIIKTMLNDLKKNFNLDSDETKNETKNESKFASEQYRIFKNNLSAYIDNELPDNENLKIKKFAINNSNARKELENSYNIRRIMNDSFKKAQTDVRQDFSKNILKQLELEEEANYGFHPIVKLLVISTITVLVLTSIVLLKFSI